MEKIIHVIQFQENRLVLISGETLPVHQLRRHCKKFLKLVFRRSDARKISFKKNITLANLHHQLGWFNQKT